MFSKGGFVFGIINIIGNFGTVFCDQVCALPSAGAKKLGVSPSALNLARPASNYPLSSQ